MVTHGKECISCILTTIHPASFFHSLPHPPPVLKRARAALISKIANELRKSCKCDRIKIAAVLFDRETESY